MTPQEPDLKGPDLALFGKLFDTLNPYRMPLIGALVALVAGAAAEVAVPVLLQSGIDHGVLGSDLGWLTAVSVAILVILLTGMVASFFQVYLLSRISQDVMTDLRTRLFAHLQRQSSRFHHDHPVGRLVSAVTSDVATLSEFFNTLFTSLLKDFVIMVGVIIALFILNTPLALLTVLTLPPVLVLVALFRVWSRRASRQVRARVARVNAFLSEHLAGISVVQLFGRQSASQKEFAQENTGLLKANLTELMVNAVFRPLIDLLWAVSLAFLLWFGVGLSAQDAVTLGVLIAFINLVGRFYQPMASLAENFTALQSALAGAERVFGFLEQDHRVPDGGQLTFAQVSHPTIRFEDVHFRYLADEPVLRGLDFEVAPGQTVALVGYTGAGKTTITSLLTRMWDVDQGRILYGGHDLREFRLDELRRGVQGVLQDVFLFHGTVRDNLDLGRGLDPSVLEAACRRVQIHDFLASLPQGYDTVLTEGATNFSSGQRQLLSFARVLVQNPQVLILDEATAMVDTETEVLIQAALATLLEGRTSLVIAHRLSTIRRADQILVLDGGRIAERGTHEELLALKGFYYNLYKLQYEKATRLNA